ncbi:MAG: MOSC domain-containing protein [Burkholderiaceae bacterium]
MRLLSVNTGVARPLSVAGGRSVLSGIVKTSVAGPVAVGMLGLQGDEQADLSVHGGRDKAVYAYPVEHLPFWVQERSERGLGGGALPPGFMGENLSIEGLLEDQVWIGDTLHFPDASLRVTAPREPCYKFTEVMGFAQAGKRMMQQGCCGFYLSVVRPGQLQVGDGWSLEPGPRGLSVREAFHAKRLKHLR